MPSNSLRSRVAFVTGASRGIGQAIAQRLAREGFAVALVSNEGDRLEAVAQAIRADGQRALAIQMDVTSAAEIAKAVEHAERELGPIEVLINGAGVAYYGGVEHGTDEEWTQTMAVNLTGYYRVAKAVLTGMKERRAGSIINMSSVWGQQGSAAMTAYAVSKYGIEGLTSSLALELGKFGIKVSSVVLDKVDTDFRDKMTSHVNFSAEQRQRMLRADDVAETVSFILSTSSRCLPESITLKAWLF